MTIVVAAIGGIVLVAICNANRGSAVASVSGVPWVIPFVLVVLVVWTFVYNRTKLGRYMYAVGANPEAARRAGINVAGIRTITFALCGFSACLAGLVYASQLGSISTDYDGGSIVLFAVAAAVIGGTSLFGGRGKPVHSLLGGLIIGVVVQRTRPDERECGGHLHRDRDRVARGGGAGRRGPAPCDGDIGALNLGGQWAADRSVPSPADGPGRCGTFGQRGDGRVDVWKEAIGRNGAWREPGTLQLVADPRAGPRDRKLDPCCLELIECVRSSRTPV